MKKRLFLAVLFSLFVLQTQCVRDVEIRQHLDAQQEIPDGQDQPVDDNDHQAVDFGLIDVLIYMREPVLGFYEFLNNHFNIIVDL